LTKHQINEERNSSDLYMFRLTNHDEDWDTVQTMHYVVEFILETIREESLSCSEDVVIRPTQPVPINQFLNLSALSFNNSMAYGSLIDYFMTSPSTLT